MRSIPLVEVDCGDGGQHDGGAGPEGDGAHPQYGDVDRVAFHVRAGV